MSIRLDTVTALDGLTDRWTELVKQYHTLHALHAIQGKNILRQDIQDQKKSFLLKISSLVQCSYGLSAKDSVCICELYFH